MVSVKEALQIITKHTQMLNSVTLPLISSRGMVTAQEIYSPLDLPPFRQSAMDGYAIRSHKEKEYSVVGEVAAGDGKEFQLKAGEAVRIFTGAMVPKTATAVIIQEKVTRQADSITINDEVVLESNIRPRGEQISKGSLALQRGTKLTPSAIGFLAGMGVTDVLVYGKPRVGIVITGNELVAAGEVLKEGQIYEGNSKMIQAVLEEMSIEGCTKYQVADNFEGTCEVLKKAFQENEVVLVNGGISVGDHDHVYEALKVLCVDSLFYKVRQKPGKPLFFGKQNNKIVFALPGNPAAALTCFYVYVYPALQKVMGHEGMGLERRQLAVTKAVTNILGRTLLLKAKILENGEVEILEGQSSAMLHTYSLANALVLVPESVDSVPKGGLVEVLMLPN
ncbi:molybdopterin molybdotransferase MoeA [Sediminicola arcticus]|jgi:molybdopterin molybdotransferase|uniref:Molybdopterin molybdenumtransferase n=1 Tax=Sediminicola arcticus TaxID=1574308 RepID=A0ABV2SVG8_9FLAO